ncbi:hypothetical protein ACFOSV_09810 [Algoriphagus namhaensis]|uniref:Uncharacterized protein n=1 Tax=Algoriphagus namhaensis TaxID=915353 RepID=A0ABV8AR51_9BACT
MKFNFNLLFLIGTILCSACKESSTKSSAPISEIKDYKGTGSITQGLAETTVQGIFTCDQPRTRVVAMGEIKDQSGKVWIVPAQNSFTTATKASDLYNECNDVTPSTFSDVDLSSIPVSEIDPEGEIITGYLFADNYFEFYINGQLIAVDPAPYTPFNSSVVRFKVNKPYTIAVKLIDWEENLGLGSENLQGKSFQPGDGGFIASFSDGTITNNQWKAQTFYASPIKDLNCLSEVGEKRLSTNCDETGVDDGTTFYGVHWEIPSNSFETSFDDSNWPNATTYTEEIIGVDNKMAYMNFIEKFKGAGAEFIWSTNVVLDNEVIVRFTVE